MGVNVTFDPVTRIIQIDVAPSLVDGEYVNDLDFQVDVYSDGKEDYKSDPEFSKVTFPIIAIGGQPTVGGKFLGSTYFLDPTWKIRPHESDHRNILTGNVYSEDGKSIWKPTVGSYNVSNEIEFTNLIDVVSTGGSLLQDGDLSNIADYVWDEDLSVHSVLKSASTAVRGTTYGVGTLIFDSVNGSPGTGWPIGTTYEPSNNLTDALLIILFGKVNDMVIKSDLTIGPTHDISNLLIRTIGLMGTDVVLTAGCIAHQTSFRNVNLSGTVTNGNELLIYDSSIGELTNFSGIMNNVAFLQGSEVTLGYWAEIIQGTAGGEPTNEVEINIGTASLNMSHWTGNLKLTGKTGANRTVINCDSGNIIIDSTCVAGTIQILGNAVVEDNSGVGCSVDIDSVISVEGIADGVWDEPVAEHIAAGSTGISLFKVLGLVQENQYIDQQVYTAGKLDSARIRIYTSAGSVGTDNDVLATYTMTATYDGENLDSYKVVKA